MKNILITGSAGFIGYHLSKNLLKEGFKVIGIDNMNDYYDISLKEKRNEILEKYDNYEFIKEDISEYEKLFENLKEKKIDMIVHLAAQAGVRYSLINPWTYVRSNVMGMVNILELARNKKIEKVVYASSSSIYGGNEKVPFSENDNVDKPVSLYAATKKSDELIAHVYSKTFGIKTIGLRFFTVYGPFGRPDMAPWLFTKNIIEEKEIKVFNYGKMYRDFTYIDDIVEGIKLAMKYNANYEIFNLGNDRPVELEKFISLIEKYTGKKAIKKYMEIQPGDVERTWADLTKSKKELGYEPKISIEKGLKKFVEWFEENVRN